MKAQKLIEILQQLHDPDLAEIEFYIGDNEDQVYDVEGISQYGISADASITLMPIEVPLMKSLVAQRQHKDMLDNAKKEIMEEK